jgi:hypothetical protein
MWGVVSLENFMFAVEGCSVSEGSAATSLHLCANYVATNVPTPLLEMRSDLSLYKRQSIPSNNSLFTEKQRDAAQTG